VSVATSRAEGARILVTGSEGFVGRHLRAALESRGAECVGLDRPGTSAQVAADLANPDLDPMELWQRIGPVSAVIHLAADITRTSSVDDAARSNLQAIAVAPVRLVEAALGRGQRPHLVTCSSFKVYGPSPGPIDPRIGPRRPDPWSYGSAKVLGERLIAVAASRAGFTYAVLRPTCIYGPGQHAKNAIPLFLRAALAGQAPRVFGAGNSVRDDVFAPDLAELLAEAALRRIEGEFNAGGEGSRTIREVAGLCCQAVQALGRNAPPEPVLDTSKPAKWWLDQVFDLGPTRQAFGYTPTPLLEGLIAEARWLSSQAPSLQ
jgi:nucleoside-diphosphate-sugar epimerase